MKVDVCLEMVFENLPAKERIVRISEAGFDSVEFWFHDSSFDGSTLAPGLAKDAATVRQACKAAGVTVNNMVVNSPDGSIGGSPVDANDFGKYIERLHEVIEYARSIDCDMAITCSGNMVPGLSRGQMRANLEKAYSEAAKVAEKKDFRLVVEPLNTLVDHAGYYLDSSDEAAEIVRAIASPNFRLLYDIYHMGVMKQDVAAQITKSIDIIGHFHAAGVPGRHEINTGDINYLDIIEKIAALGYKGSFGLEYSPSTPDSRRSLLATRRYLSKVM